MVVENDKKKSVLEETVGLNISTINIGNFCSNLVKVMRLYGS